jgi:hypothetical protein
MTAPAPARINWDAVGGRTFETGVDRGVLYVRDATGAYPVGVPWSGLTGVTETPSGAAATPLYADNIKYLNLISVEHLDGTITAYTYPEEWAQCDGSEAPVSGVSVGQQGRKTFGMCYRTRLGNDVDGTDHGYKLHLLYGAVAAPSARAYATINDTPAAIDFSWGFSTSAVEVPNLKPTSLITVDSTLVDPTELATLEDALYGSPTAVAHLPLPAEILSILTPTGP